MNFYSLDFDVVVAPTFDLNFQIFEGVQGKIKNVWSYYLSFKLKRRLVSEATDG